MRNLPSTKIFNNLDDMFSDLNRFAIGFEPMFMRINSLHNPDRTGYPPYNLDHDEEGKRYRLELAVAGFKLEELEITVTNENVLVVKGSKLDQPERTWLHRGIAARDFERHFTLADQIKIISAKLEDGLLTIELERQDPAGNTRKIPIANGNIIDV